MDTDAYIYTDKLNELLRQENRILTVSKEFFVIKDNAEKVKFLEELLLEKELIPNQVEGMRKKKCNEISKKFRVEGNLHYSNRIFFDALECYNKSLCYAEENSENIGLAFASKYQRLITCIALRSIYIYLHLIKTRLTSYIHRSLGSLSCNGPVLACIE
jgi:hypothetical protein